MVAPIIGFLYGRTSEIDENNSHETTKIFPEQLIKEFSTLKFIYQLIMLLDSKNESSFNERLNIAFRNYGRPAAKDEQVFESYVRGGIDVLFEKLIENPDNGDDYLRNLYDFCEEFHQRYNDKVSDDIILELCSLARS